MYRIRWTDSICAVVVVVVVSLLRFFRGFKPSFGQSLQHFFISQLLHLNIQNGMDEEVKKRNGTHSNEHTQKKRNGQSDSLLILCMCRMIIGCLVFLIYLFFFAFSQEPVLWCAIMNSYHKIKAECNIYMKRHTKKVRWSAQRDRASKKYAYIGCFDVFIYWNIIKKHQLKHAKHHTPESIKKNRCEG